MNNLPPGVTINMLPGNTPEEALYDHVFEKLPTKIQDEIHSGSDIGARLDQEFQRLLPRLFPEDDLIRELLLFESCVLQEQRDSLRIPHSVEYEISNLSNSPVKVEINLKHDQVSGVGIEDQEDLRIKLTRRLPRHPDREYYLLRMRQDAGSGGKPPLVDHIRIQLTSAHDKEPPEKFHDISPELYIVRWVKEDWVTIPMPLKSNRYLVFTVPALSSVTIQLCDDRNPYTNVFESKSTHDNIPEDRQKIVRMYMSEKKIDDIKEVDWLEYYRWAEKKFTEVLKDTGII